MVFVIQCFGFVILLFTSIFVINSVTCTSVQNYGKMLQALIKVNEERVNAMNKLYELQKVSYSNLLRSGLLNDNVWNPDDVAATIGDENEADDKRADDEIGVIFIKDKTNNSPNYPGRWPAAPTALILPPLHEDRSPRPYSLRLTHKRNATESDEESEETSVEDSVSDEKIPKKVLRGKNWRNSCDKEARKACNKACTKAYKNTCKDYKCSDKFKKRLKKECKSSCNDLFLSGSDKGSVCNIGDVTVERR